MTRQTRLAPLLAGALLALTGCATLTIDVAVYKGPLSVSERSAQLEVLKSYISATEFILADAGTLMERREECDRTGFRVAALEDEASELVSSVDEYIELDQEALEAKADLWSRPLGGTEDLSTAATNAENLAQHALVRLLARTTGFSENVLLLAPRQAECFGADNLAALRSYGNSIQASASEIHRDSVIERIRIGTKDAEWQEAERVISELSSYAPNPNPLVQDRLRYPISIALDARLALDRLIMFLEYQLMGLLARADGEQIEKARDAIGRREKGELLKAQAMGRATAANQLKAALEADPQAATGATEALGRARAAKFTALAALAEAEEKKAQALIEAAEADAQANRDAESSAAEAERARNAAKEAVAAGAPDPALEEVAKDAEAAARRAAALAEAARRRASDAEALVDTRTGLRARANALKKALEAAYARRALMATLHPASAYLRTTDSELVGAIGRHSRNMLDDQLWVLRPDWMRKLSPFSKKTYERLRLADQQSWQRVNRVRVTGVGTTNYVVAKDDMGNWYVKGYSSNVEDIVSATQSLALFAAGGSLGTDLVNLPREGEGATDEDASAAAAGGRTSNQYVRFRDVYGRETEAERRALADVLETLPGMLEDLLRPIGYSVVIGQAEANLVEARAGLGNEEAGVNEKSDRIQQAIGALVTFRAAAATAARARTRARVAAARASLATAEAGLAEARRRRDSAAEDERAAAQNAVDAAAEGVGDATAAVAKAEAEGRQALEVIRQQVRAVALQATQRRIRAVDSYRTALGVLGNVSAGGS